MTQESLKLAVKDLERSESALHKARAAIKEALARPEQEPLGWVDDGGMVFWKDKPPADGSDIYTTPPQRTWVGLTDEEMTHTNHHMVEGAYQYSFKQGAKWAEAKLKERNT